MSTFDHLTRENVAAINRSKLESLREKVNLAEAGLRNARDQYEAEIERQGKPTAGIFADTVFVRRASSDRWLAEAENEFNAREAQNFAHVNEALRIIAAKKAIDDENDTEDENPYPDQEDDDDGGDDQSPDRPRDKSKKKGKKRAKDDAEPSEGDEAAARFFAPREAGDDEYWDQVNASAAAVVAAAAKARGGHAKRPPWEANGVTKSSHLTVVPNALLPPKGSPARAIIDAGKRRRGEES